MERKIEIIFDNVRNKLKLETLRKAESMKLQLRSKEDEITTIRAAKSELSYHASQSLLKAINLLNMEVLDLKQSDLISDFSFVSKRENNIEMVLQKYVTGIFF